MGGGAWPFLGGGVIGLVNSVNERDLNLLNSRAHPAISKNLCAVAAVRPERASVRLAGPAPCAGGWMVRYPRAVARKGRCPSAS